MWHVTLHNLSCRAYSFPQAFFFQHDIGICTHIQYDIPVFSFFCYSVLRKQNVSGICSFGNFSKGSLFNEKYQHINPIFQVPEKLFSEFLLLVVFLIFYLVCVCSLGKGPILSCSEFFYNQSVSSTLINTSNCYGHTQKQQ